MLLTSPGGIYSTLFSRCDPKFLQVLDYTISYSWQSCCGERAGSYINQIKTASRADLDPVALDSLAYNAFNMPSLHEIDFNSLIRQWSDDGKLSGVLKTDRDRSSAESKVIQRHLSSVKHTFLFTGRSPYANPV